jgi:hypothetical protein
MADAAGRRVMFLRRRLAVAQHRHNLILVALLAEEERLNRRLRRQRRWWIKPWILRRQMFGQFDTLMSELEREHTSDFKNFLRMEPAMFRELLRRVGPRITKSKKARTALKPALKLAITLRFLASGSSYHSLAFAFRVPHNTICLFVPEVCEAIVAEYRDEVFNTPNDPATWRPVAERFGNRWNCHHCCGALDGKHIAIKKPTGTGTTYYNYKGFFSIVLMALVDADYRFLWVDIGANGSASDCGVFNRSQMEPALKYNTIGFPPPEPLPNDDRNMPFFLAGDDAFPLRSYLMKPYSMRYLTREQRIFNYRLSRARRVVENTFGILASRFRCLLTTMNTTPENSTSAVKACVTLHNVMRMRYPALQNADLDGEDQDHNVHPGAWRTAAVMREVERAGRGPRLTAAGKRQRAYLTKYYNCAAGSVAWQDDAIDA